MRMFRMMLLLALPHFASAFHIKQPSAQRVARHKPGQALGQGLPWVLPPYWRAARLFTWPAEGRLAVACLARRPCQAPWHACLGAPVSLRLQQRWGRGLRAWPVQVSLGSCWPQMLWQTGVESRASHAAYIVGASLRPGSGSRDIETTVRCSDEHVPGGSIIFRE